MLSLWWPVVLIFIIPHDDTKLVVCTGTVVIFQLLSFAAIIILFHRCGKGQHKCIMSTIWLIDLIYSVLIHIKSNIHNNLYQRESNNNYLRYMFVPAIRPRFASNYNIRALRFYLRADSILSIT